MGAEKDIIIAVELASTAIRAIAGKREPDGSMQVLAFAQEESPNTIRKGIIDNIDKTTQALTRVVAKLSDKLGVRVNSVYVGLGGQSLRSVHNRVLLQFDGLELLSHKTIDKMRDTNSGVVYPNAEIKEVVPQEFTIGSRSIVDPVGMQAEMLEANFINIIARPTLEENIRKCVNAADGFSGESDAGMLVCLFALCPLLDESDNVRSVSMEFHRLAEHSRHLLVKRCERMVGMNL